MSITATIASKLVEIAAPHVSTSSLVATTFATAAPAAKIAAVLGGAAAVYGGATAATAALASARTFGVFGAKVKLADGSEGVICRVEGSTVTVGQRGPNGQTRMLTLRGEEAKEVLGREGLERSAEEGKAIAALIAKLHESSTATQSNEAMQLGDEDNKKLAARLDYALGRLCKADEDAVDTEAALRASMDAQQALYERLLEARSANEEAERALAESDSILARYAKRIEALNGALHASVEGKIDATNETETELSFNADEVSEVAAEVAADVEAEVAADVAAEVAADVEADVAAEVAADVEAAEIAEAAAKAIEEAATPEEAVSAAKAALTASVEADVCGTTADDADDFRLDEEAGKKPQHEEVAA